MSGCGQATQASPPPAWVLGDCTVDKVTADEESTFGQGLIVSAPAVGVTGEGTHDTTTQFELYNESGTLVDSGEFSGPVDFTAMATLDAGSLSNSLYVFEGDYPNDNGYTCTARVIVYATGAAATTAETEAAAAESTTPKGAQVDLRTGVEVALTEAVDAQFGNGDYAECGETAMSLESGAEFTCWFKSGDGAGIQISVVVTDENGGLWWGSMSGNGVNGTAQVPMDGTVSMVPYKPPVDPHADPVVEFGDCSITRTQFELSDGTLVDSLRLTAPIVKVVGTGVQDFELAYYLLDVEDGNWSGEDKFLYEVDLSEWTADPANIPPLFGEVTTGVDPDMFTCQAKAWVPGPMGTDVRKTAADFATSDPSDWPDYQYTGPDVFNVCRADLPLDVSGNILLGTEPDEGTDEWWIITSLQAALRSLNYGNPDPLPVTGTFGPLTEKAVKSFQDRRGLDVTGSVDPELWNMVRTRMDRFDRCS